MNAHFVLRIATDRDWAADVRAQSFWLEETNRWVYAHMFISYTLSSGLESATITCIVASQFSLQGLTVSIQK